MEKLLLTVNKLLNDNFGKLLPELSYKVIEYTDGHSPYKIAELYLEYDSDNGRIKYHLLSSTDFMNDKGIIESLYIYLINNFLFSEGPSRISDILYGKTALDIERIQ